MQKQAQSASDSNPAHLAMVGIQIYTEPTELQPGYWFVGTVYTYQVLDANGNPIIRPMIVREVLTVSPLTGCLPVATEGPTPDGTFKDRVGYRTTGQSDAGPANHSNTVIQNFVVTQGCVTTVLSTTMMQTVTSDWKATFTAQSTMIVW